MAESSSLPSNESKYDYLIQMLATHGILLQCPQATFGN